MKSEPRPEISAVVRTWNSARTLAQALLSLRMQKERVGEIIIVDSGSSDATRQIADRFGCRWVDYPAGREFNYAESLNLGIAAALGSEILIVSSHTVLAYRDIVGIMRANLHQHGAAGVYCTHTRSRAQFPSYEDPERGRSVQVTRADTFHGYNGLSNSCSLIRRECWERHSFDPAMPAAEDQEWAYWFFQNTARPTVRIINAGVLYLNPNYSLKKVARDYVIIATRLLPRLRSWRTICGLFRTSIRAAIRGHRERARRDFTVAFEVLKSRFFLPRYASRY